MIPLAIDIEVPLLVTALLLFVLPLATLAACELRARRRARR